MNIENSRFDNWLHVDCNDCEHYWNALCDGVAKGSEKPCTAFKATRSTDIPEQIKVLRERLKLLNRGQILLGIAIIIHALGHILGG